MAPQQHTRCDHYMSFTLFRVYLYTKFQNLLANGDNATAIRHECMAMTVVY